MSLINKKPPRREERVPAKSAKVFASSVVRYATPARKTTEIRMTSPRALVGTYTPATALFCVAPEPSFDESSEFCGELIRTSLTPTHIEIRSKSAFSRIK